MGKQSTHSSANATRARYAKYLNHLENITLLPKSMDRKDNNWKGYDCPDDVQALDGRWFSKSKSSS